MKKKWITTGAIMLLLGMPITASASTFWPGHQYMIETEENIDILDGLLTQQEKEIQDLNQTISKLEKDVLVAKETKDKAQAFDSVAQAIEKRTGFQVTVENYEHLMSKTIELLDQKNGIAKQLIKWVFG